MGACSTFTRTSGQAQDAQKITQHICWNGEGKGRIRAKGQRVPFTYETQWSPALKRWKIQMQVPLRGEYTAAVDYSQIPEEKIRWSMDSGEHVPAAGPEAWREAFLLLGKALWASTPGTTPLKWESERVEILGPDQARVIYAFGKGEEVAMDLKQLDGNYYRTVRISVTPSAIKGQGGPDSSDLELLLLLEECRPL